MRNLMDLVEATYYPIDLEKIAKLMKAIEYFIIDWKINKSEYFINM